jgi:hypothetical protein
MSNILKSFAGNGLSLTVDSPKFSGIDLKALEPFWSTLETSGLKGDFSLKVLYKETGVSGFEQAVKIAGADYTRHNVTVKFQNGAENCYHGSLTFKPQPGSPVIIAADIKEKLANITGSGWYDPANPSTKLVREQRQDKGLEDLGLRVAVSGAGMVVKDAGVADAASNTRSTGKGMTKNGDVIALLMDEFAKKSNGGIILSTTIAQIASEWSLGIPGGSRSLRGYGSAIINAMVKEGMLEPASEGSKAIPYRITSKAIERFGLAIPAQKIGLIQAAALEVEHLQAFKGQPDFDALLKDANDKAEQFINIQTELNDLTQQQKVLQARIKVLKSLGKNTELVAAHKLVGKMGGIKRVVPANN